MYDDADADIYSVLEQTEATLRHDKTTNRWGTEINVSGWDATMGSFTYLQDASANLESDLGLDLDSLKVDFGTSQLTLNDMPFSLTGFVAMPDTTIRMDLDFRSAESGFKELLSLVPLIYQSNFDALEANGDVLFSGSVKGSYDATHFPTSNLSLVVREGAFAWPDLPKQVSDVFIDLGVVNTDGTIAGTVVDLSTFRAKLGDDPLDLTFYAKDMEEDPFVRTSLDARLDLSAWREFLPLESTDVLNGTLQADIDFSGRVSDARNRQFDKIKARGSLAGKEISYSGGMLDKKLEIFSVKAGLTPQKMQVDQFKGKAGKSDLAINGWIENYLPWFFEKGTLRADLSLESDFLDLNEWYDAGSTEKTTSDNDSSATSFVYVPENMDASVRLEIGNLLYDKYDIQNIRGLLQVKDGEVSMDPLALEMLGGEMNLRGIYAMSSGMENPLIDLDVDMKEVALDQTVRTFNTVQRLAPLATRCSGVYSAGLKVKGQLEEGFAPDISTLNGLMKFQTDKLKIEKSEVISQVGQLTGSGYFESPTLSKVNALIEFKQGVIGIKPFTTNLKQAQITIAGNQGLDGAIDYTLNVDLPSEALQFEKSSVAQQLFDLPLAKTVDIKWPDRVKFDVIVGGTLKKPTVKLDVKNQVKNVTEELVDNVKDKVKEEMDKKRAELIFKAEVQAKQLLDEANKQGDKLITEAQKQADQLLALADQQIDQLKQEADKQAEDLVANAGANPLKKLAAQEAADLIRSEAQKKADKLKKEAASQANRGVEAARKQKELLVSKAKEEGERLIGEARTKEM